MNFDAKKTIIEAISDEVNVLHPLLNHLLRHIENVESVEYTHGPNEKGADFIVTRRETAFNTTHHIGVVVKVGKILQNFDEVARQVEECQLPRTIKGGTESVRLSEVWVINTATISKNAQDKIQDKYRAQKISFIQGEKLTELVDKYADYFWYDVSTDIGTYLKNLYQTLEKLDSELNVLKGLDCSNFYIQPDIQEHIKPLYARHARPPKPKLVNLQEQVRKDKVSFLEADMGFGKSKTARAIAAYYATPEVFKRHNVIPVFYSCKQVFECKRTLTELLEISAQGYFDKNKFRDSQILFIIDGVDEASAKCPDWRDQLQKLVKEANNTQKYHLLLTSRPLRQLDEPISVYAGTTRYSLRPLSINKLIAFIEQACESLALPKRLFEDLQKSDLFKQLPQSPIAAALLSRLISQNTNDLPSNLTELYSKSIENLLGRWDIDKGGCTEKEYKDTERVSFMLADYIVGNQLPHMNLQEAIEKIENWHRERNTNVDIARLKDRVLYKSGIFITDEDSNLIYFRHRSFGEFLHAKSLQSNRKSISPTDSFSPYWAYIQFFYTGLLGDCEDHLRELLSYQPKSETESWLKVLLMPDYLLAGYQTPYHIVEDNLYKIFIEGAELYKRIRNGDTKTRLAELPEMHLLWFFQRVIRNCFEYEFFRRSINTTILKIDQEIQDQKTKEIALFFAACFAAELEDATGLEYLVKHYPAEKIQLSIALAIKLEQETNKDFTKLPILKEHEKHLNSLMLPRQGSKKLASLEQSKALDDLFEKPVKSRNFD